ncbi:hypothetical protein [Wielerella bovis]|uniref:hypothetical protein n=1 Tax=Wielerella bovis TaxID=2917790 RepID=UPI00201898A4|nr:hypothetical protein [Wielerella bovis]ULJ59726.1 hypothetical protein MIS44_08565 [Wielerella bovis]ULJ64162.1 hypothetical protein MIS33_08355 [Wielerella bovis]ULJ67922.1 hypothetical protein MIS31_05115 [Wielerella bovis]
MSKNALFNRYPSVIIGEAYDSDDEFAVHTRYPRFICKITFTDKFTGDLEVVVGEIGLMQPNNKLIYHTDNGLYLQDFIFMDTKPTDEEKWKIEFDKACKAIIATLLLLDDRAQREIGI